MAADPRVDDQGSPLLGSAWKLEQGETMCRICFEDDDPQNMFQPCRCSGDQQWVHVECLDQWRATSANPEAFSRCLTCQYEYRLEVKPPELNWFDRVNLGLSRNICFLCLLILLQITVGGLIIRSLDHHQVIYEFFRDYIYQEQPNSHGKYSVNNEYFYYYVFTSYVYLILIGLASLINIARMKNRLLYLRYILGYDWFCGLLRIVTITTLTVLTFYLSIYMGCLITTLEIQTIIRAHYLFIHYRFKAQRNQILPYDKQHDDI